MITYKNKALITIPYEFNLSMKKIRKNSNRKTLENNLDIYINWVLDTLKSIYNKEIDDKKYNACCLYLNKKNLDILQNYLDPWSWMNYSPVECNDLGDDELGVDLNDMVQDNI